MSRKYRVGVIGATGRGNYGHGLNTVFSRNAQCEVLAVADADERGRAQIAEKLRVKEAFADYREMLDVVKPDVIAIGPRWIDQHRDMIVAAAERGIHIFIEKPLCRSPQEADEIVAACEKRNVKLALAHQTRYSPVLAVVRDLVEDGRIGEFLELRGRGKEDARGGGEDLWVLGSHVLNLMHHLAGEPHWCSAAVWQGGKLAERGQVRQGNEGIGPLLGDEVVATYGFADGVTGHFGSKKNAQGGRFGLQIFGSRGVIEITTGYLPAAFLLEDPNWSPGRSGAKWTPITSAGVGQPEPLRDGSADAGNDAAVADLLDAIEDDRQPECSMYEGRTTIEMISGVFSAHLAAARVELPLKRRENPLG